MTNQEDYTLRVEIGTNTGGTKFAEYEMFRIGNEDSQYYLENVGTLTGNAGKQPTTISHFILLLIPFTNFPPRIE